ncbi:MAG: ATP-grasp domain-containing protein [Salibacteraceae bacterium]
MSQQKLTIALTGLNNHDSPGPGIPVARALREMKGYSVRIIGLCYESMEPGLFMHDLIDRSYLIPYPHAGNSSLLHRLREIHEKEQFDLIIPNFDAELKGFIAAQETFESWGVRTFLPSLQQLQEREKVNLPVFGNRYAVAVPDSQPVFQVEDIRTLAGRFGFPLVVKGQFYEAEVVQNYDQAVKAFFKISGTWGLPIVVQKFVHGLELNVVAIGDGEGNTLGMVPMRKRYTTAKGKAWAGITIDDPELMAFATDLIRKTRWKGPLELELIKDTEGNFQVLEINPRFPAWVYLANGAGQNLPARLVEAALGKTPQSEADYAVGKMFIRYSYDLICDRSEFETLAALGEG